MNLNGIKNAIKKTIILKKKKIELLSIKGSIKNIQNELSNDKLGRFFF